METEKLIRNIKLYRIGINEDTILEEMIKFVDSILEKVEPKIDEKNPDWITYYVGNVLYINRDLKNKHFLCRYNEFWHYFEKQYSMDYKEIQFFFNYLLEEHFKCKGYKTLAHGY